MLPKLLEIGPFTVLGRSIGPLSIYSYGTMFALGFLAALYVMRRNARALDLDADVIADAAFNTLIVGLVGSRVLHIIMFPEMYSWSDPLGWVAIWRGGLVFQGAILPGMLFLAWYLRRRGLPYWRTLDSAAPAMALCHAFGRMGCFLNGCCWGKISDVPWAIPFRRIPWDTAQPLEGSPPFEDHYLRFGAQRLAEHWHCDLADVHWSLPVHPTQLYSVAALLTLFGILVLLLKRFHRFDGLVICSYLALYSIFRFVNEFFRGDHNPVRFDILSDQQLISIGLFVALLVLGSILWRYSKRTQ